MRNISNFFYTLLHPQPKLSDPRWEKWFVGHMMRSTKYASGLRYKPEKKKFPGW